MVPGQKMVPHVRVSENVAEAGSTQINNITLNTTYTADDLNRACLQALRCPKSVDIKTRLKKRDKLLYKSIEWVIQDVQFKQWQADEEVSLLWIKGTPGKGKTMLSIGLVERLEPLERALDPRGQPPIIAYFFCQDTNYELNTIEGIIKGLIMCLVDQHKELYEPLRHRWDSDNWRFKEDLASWQALWDIFTDMLQRCKSQKIYIVIDALDECRDEDMAAFMQYLVRTGFYPNVKWFVTSRPSFDAGRELLASSDQVMVSFDLNAGHVRGAVKTYIVDKVKELRRRHGYGPALCKQLEDELANRAEDTYLWVSLVCKSLETIEKARVLPTLQEMPSGLEPFYKRAFNKLAEGEPAVVDSCMRLLKAMLTVYRPLREEEISSVACLPLEDFPIERLLDQCGSFITKRGDNIEFIHQSARDYLDQGQAQTILNSYRSWSHEEIALSCLRHLSQHLKVNIANLPRPDSERDSIETRPGLPGKGTLNNVDYAATFWAKHLADGVPNSMAGALGDRGEVLVFLRTKLLEWFECLSLLGQLPRAIEALKTLADLSQPSSPMAALVQDALRFLLRHYRVMSTWPLQIYSSAMAFSPQTSVVRVANHDKIPEWLKALPQVEVAWASLVQTLRGHSASIYAVAFSPDGKHIASGSRDQTIKLWDATTGDCKKTLQGHKYHVSAIAFSPDGNYIASGSRVEMKLWDATTGDCELALTGHHHSVSAIAFSPDGKHIASGSGDKVKLWDAMTGDGKKKLTGHSNRVHTIAFSPDGRHIASGSYDRTIKLWDAATGDCKRTLSGHNNTVAAIAFSPDGKHIASGSYDQTIRLWDAITGDCKRTLTADNHSVSYLAYSPDGKYVASGSNDNAIKLWDAATGNCKKILTDHNSLIGAIAFSPDGKHIASGCYDETIKLWDATIDDCKRTLAGHNDWVTAIAFSPDGKHVASGSNDKAVKLWDAATGDCKRTLTGHNRHISALVFSPDSKSIASGSYARTILWDATTGDDKKTLTGHNYWVSAIAFSPDGKHIASGFADETIELWDAATGNCKMKLTGYDYKVEAIAFSPDGNHIAASSTGGTVILLDVTEALRPSSYFGKMFGSYLSFWSKREIKIQQSIRALKYSEDGRSLVTDAGILRVDDIESDASGCSFSPSEELSVTDGWLCYGTMRLLHLASDSTPECFDINEDQIAVGMRSGHVFIFGIDRRRLGVAS